jgi:hypothetical protein
VATAPTGDPASGKTWAERSMHGTQQCSTTVCCRTLPERPDPTSDLYCALVQSEVSKEKCITNEQVTPGEVEKARRGTRCGMQRGSRRRHGWRRPWNARRDAVDGGLWSSATARPRWSPLLAWCIQGKRYWISRAYREWKWEWRLCLPTMIVI